MLESAYLRGKEPWQQSGFSGPAERWEVCRRPIGDCVKKNGMFLDIGCANGYLLECLMRWTAERGIQIEPWGLDLSEKLVAMAKQRLPDHTGKLLVGNAFTWKPPQKFDYVRTELCYVPERLQRQYVRQLLEEFLGPSGSLLVAEYRSRSDPSKTPWVDVILREMGFAVDHCEAGFWEEKELTRVAVIKGAPQGKPGG